MPNLDPRLLAGTFLPPAGGSRISGDHGPVDGCPQLPGGLRAGVSDDDGFDAGCVLIIEAADLIGDHHRLEPVNLSRCQGTHR
jgi:hypothetical protein